MRFAGSRGSNQHEPQHSHGGCWPFHSQPSQTNNLQNVYLSLSVTLNIIRTWQGLVISSVGSCGQVRLLVMTSSLCGKQYKVANEYAASQASVHLIWPNILPGCKTNNNKNIPKTGLVPVRLLYVYCIYVSYKHMLVSLIGSFSTSANACLVIYIGHRLLCSDNLRLFAASRIYAWLTFQITHTITLLRGKN